MQQFSWETSKHGDHNRELHITEFSTLITGEQGELFWPVPVPVQLAGNSQGEDPVSALGAMIQMGDAPACNICGSLMVRSGTCYRCMTCGGTSGCS